MVFYVKKITRNPYKVVFTLQSKVISPIKQEAILDYNSTTIVLQRVMRTATGKYVCRIDTDRGSLVSPPITLTVKPVSIAQV